MFVLQAEYFQHSSEKLWLSYVCKAPFRSIALWFYTKTEIFPYFKICRNLSSKPTTQKKRQFPMNGYARVSTGFKIQVHSEHKVSSLFSTKEIHVVFVELFLKESENSDRPFQNWHFGITLSKCCWRINARNCF